MIDYSAGAMTDINKILASSPGLTDADFERVHHLVADWQVIADLTNADLQLAVPAADGHFVYAAQCRPSTNISVRPEDLVGTLVSSELRPMMIRAMVECDEVHADDYEVHGMPVSTSAAGVRSNGRAVGVLVRESNPASRMQIGRVEKVGCQAGRAMFAMVTTERFPYAEPVNKLRHNARVADGFLVLDANGIVACASPNAISCLKRLGYISQPEGQRFIDVGKQFVRNSGTADTRQVFAAREPQDVVVDDRDASVSIRALPLYDDDTYCGAVILMRDVTELRLRDQELKLKDATIAEVHHRVKNNLQAVSALLRLQSRRTDNQEVKSALSQAQRRIQTIAILHEGLSKSADEELDFDPVVANLLRMSVEVASADDQQIGISFVGTFGQMSALDATPLSLILTELVTNSVEHGFEGRRKGHITITAGRYGDDLNIQVEDDGNGLGKKSDEKPNATSDGTAGSEEHEYHDGLGTQIITTFVKSDFNGTIAWEPRQGGGTRVVLNIRLRGAHPEE